MFHRNWALGMVLAISALASPAQAGVIQDIGKLKVEIATAQGRIQQLQTDYGSSFTPAQQQKVDEITASLLESQNKAETLLGMF